MPTTPQMDSKQLAEIVRNYYKQKYKAPADFARPKTTEDQINSMPNADKLTKLERGIYGALPGVTSWMENNRIMGLTVSEQLDKFNSGWMGKALNVMDIAAEGFERFVGTGETIIQSGQDFDWSSENLKAVWYGSSLYWDMTNLPTLKRDSAGRVVGLQIGEDLPGVDGLKDAQIKIKRLMEQGMNPQEAIAKVRDDYYGGLGALALRAQINDMWGHVLGDPANLVTAYVKPLEMLKVRRFHALTTKLTGGVDDILEAADKSADLLRTADNADDALKYANEAYELANMAGDTKRAAQFAAEAADAARKAGRVDDAARYEREAIRVATMGKKAAAEYSEQALYDIGRKQLTTGDKLAIMLTGGDPFRPSKVGQWAEKVPVVGRLAKTFNLTPESKAREILTLVSDNVGTNVIARMMMSPNAEADFVSYLRRVSKGASGIEFGHAAMTLEGRTVQSFTKGAASGVERLYSTYKQLGKERAMLKTLSDVTGESPTKLLAQMEEAPEVIADALFRKRGANPAIDALLQTGALKTEELRALAKTLKDVPHNKEMFFAAALDAIETQTMRQAVVQFGVKSKGVVTRWADAMKAAESLAFLRINPGYPIRNKLNNDFTMIARGLFGVMSDQAVDSFWEGFGRLPKRLGDAITPAQEGKLTQSLTEADRLLDEALTGGYYGAPDKVKEFFQKLDLGKLDTAKHWGQKIEQKASRKAFTMGAQQYIRKYFKPKGIGEYIARPALLDELEQASPEFARHFDNAVRASGAMEGKFDELLGTNLNLNVDSILDDVGQQLGMDMRDVLGDELLEHVHQNLPRALNEGTLDAFKVQTREMVNNHIEDLFNKQIENVVEHVKAQAIAGGESVWMQKLGEAQDIFWGAHIEHSIRMPEATRLAREASQTGDYAAARALWQQEQADARRFYDRAFRRVDAYIQGLEEGAGELANRGYRSRWSEVRASFDEWQNGWKQFFEEKNRLQDEFWEAFDKTPKGQRPPRSIDDLRRQIQSMYSRMEGSEDEIMQRIDDTVASMIDDPQAKTAYLNARDTLAEMRRADKREVNKMYQRTADMMPEDRQAAWNEFWQARVQRYQNMRSVEAASVAIQQGDPNAAMMFSQARQAGQEATEGFDVYKLAEEYGVPTATTTGGRNERRVLNTVNKYSGARVDLSNKAVTVPRSELPPLVNERFEQIARTLQKELFEGEAGKRISGEVAEGGAVTTKWQGISSTNADWYRELYAEGIRKPAIDKAIEKILKDKGADKGKNVERVKEIILQRLKFGDPDQGIPPDLYALTELGASKKSLQEALDNFNDITKQELSLEDAILQAMPDDMRAGVSYDAAGNLQLPGRYTNLAEVPEDVARSAFESRARAKGLELPAQEPQVTPEFIGEVNKVIPAQAPLDLGMDMMTYGRSYGAIDSIVDGAKAAAQRTPTMLSDLPQHLQDEVMKAVRQAKNDMASTRYNALKFGEWRRDSALLNYNRRTNFDNYLGHVAPFVFWSTSSMMQWAIESIDRPAALTNFLRARKFFATAGLQQDGQASRAKGKLRIQLPFAPDWMGDQFIDPLRLVLPFDNWLSPFEQMRQQTESVNGRTERLLQQQLQEGSITQSEYDSAVESKTGAVWDYARTKTAGNDNDDNFDAWDFGTALAAPHAPIMWAYNAAMGQTDEIPSFTPLSRIARNAATMLGVEDWNNSNWNLEAKIRRQMGLPAFDKWDDYRIDRSLSNLAGSGEYTVDEVKEALAISALVQQGKIDPEAAKEMSEAYREGVKRSNQEYTGGLFGGILATLGIPVTTVTEGEQELRALQDDFGAAYGRYKQANDSLEAFLEDHPEMEEELAQEAWAQQNPKLATTVDDLTEFFDKHPEYETRLGLFDPPEQRMHKFMVDEVWKRYGEMPQLNRTELADQLPGFEEAFLNKSTRNYDDVPVELMQVWLKLMGTDPLGGLTADQRVLTALYGKMQLTDPESAWRVQVFYDTRNQRHEGWREAQEEYYKLPKGGQRRAFLAKHPELKQYWDFRTTFMRDNPDLVPYLTDNEQQIAEAKNRARTTAAVPTAQELQKITAKLPPDVKELLYDFASSGDPLPPVVINELYYIAQSQGLDPQQMVNILGAGVGQ